FIAIYQFQPPPLPSGVKRYVFKNAVPFTLATPEFSSAITSLSSNFVSIFTEAHTAEQHGLTLICGAGYRKALEFLVKDYVIKKAPAETAAIKRMPLAACITKYIESPNVKQVARRAAWLGNDETHYERKWEQKDLSDLKKLIDVTIHWIEMDELTTEMMKDMPEPEKETKPV